MKVQQIIERKLREAFEPLVLELDNESGQHNVPAGSESHFRAVIVSEAFNGKRSVARHQMVYALLAAELAGGVHALSLHTLTPAEWLERGGTTAASPACMGGS